MKKMAMSILSYDKGLYFMNIKRTLLFALFISSGCALGMVKTEFALDRKKIEVAAKNLNIVIETIDMLKEYLGKPEWVKTTYFAVLPQDILKYNLIIRCLDKQEKEAQLKRYDIFLDYEI
jgi:hypothetical protein